MRERIIGDLSSQIDSSIVEDLMTAYGDLLAKHRSGDLEGALTKAGRFVEHTLRAIEFIRTSKVPPKIKSVQKTIQIIENQTSLSEPLRILIPRVVYGMMYTLRSKRDAVHVSEIDPKQIDVALAVAAASWAIAEFLHLYHTSEEETVVSAMAVLSRTAVPLIEAIEGEIFVGQKVPATMEMLLLLGQANPPGLTRKELGFAAKCSQPSVSNALIALEKDRRVHLVKDNNYFITSSGEQLLAALIASHF